MANWSFKQLASGKWGAQGYFPKGEGAPHDEEILGQIVQIARKDGTSQSKRITGINDWFVSPQGWSSVRCEFENAEDNGAKGNLPSAPPSAPPSAQEMRLAYVTPDGVFRAWVTGSKFWQPSPGIHEAQERYESVGHY